MTCSHAQTLIQLYLDGRLDARRLPVLTRHLHSCAACRADLVSYQLVADGAAAVSAPRHPEALTRSIMRRVRQVEAWNQLPASRRAVSLRWADALLSAALATMMTLSFLYFEPALRLALSGALALSAATLTREIGLKLSSWPSLAVWLVWVGLGVVLALWFAGREVRADWRRAVVTRLTR